MNFNGGEVCGRRCDTTWVVYQVASYDEAYEVCLRLLGIYVTLSLYIRYFIPFWYFALHIWIIFRFTLCSLSNLSLSSLIFCTIPIYAFSCIYYKWGHDIQNFPFQNHRRCDWPWVAVWLHHSNLRGVSRIGFMLYVNCSQYIYAVVYAYIMILVRGRRYLCGNSIRTLFVITNSILLLTFDFFIESVYQTQLLYNDFQWCSNDRLI